MNSLNRIQRLVCLPIHLRLILMAMLWAGTFVAGRVLSASVEPLPGATARFGVALLLLLLISWKVEGGLPRLSRGQLLSTMALGATGVFLYNLFFLQALTLLPASRTAIFVALNPIVVALVMAVGFGERMSPLKWLGFVVALLGVALVVSRGELSLLINNLGSGLGAGELSIITAVLSWAAYTVIGKQALRGLTPLAATTYASLWGFLLLLGSSLVSPSASLFVGLSSEAITAILYLALGGTVIPFLWFYQGVTLLGPARTALYTNLVPVFGVLFGILLLDEPLLLPVLFGGGLVLMGVVMANYRASQVDQPSHQNLSNEASIGDLRIR
ncbi:DMT family transporter [Motiliproteus coralliicola]|uniref:DMT family transporter n=1 Tax=Motiliproteus coralliicola TaxID=2283196 RepID=A0A369WM89_9GAMM|nr:DMT family transporter [Motiliproteus coralliicola]RDE22591.1 DMT family transporter [Motiliproteus coralliicola]